MPSEISFNVTSVNVRHDMTPRQRDHDLRVAFKRYKGVKFFQEFDERSDKRALDEFAHRAGMSIKNRRTEVPVAIGKSWDIHSTQRHRLNKGRRRHNPARYLSVVLADKNSFHVAFCNMHMQQKPYESDYNRRLWREYFKQAQALMAQYCNDGYTLVYGGDLNKTEPRPYFTAHEIVRSGLDHLFVMPAYGVGVTVVRSWINRNLNTDHNLIGARIILRK